MQEPRNHNLEFVFDTDGRFGGIDSDFETSVRRFRIALLRRILGFWGLFAHFGELSVFIVG